MRLSSAACRVHDCLHKFVMLTCYFVHCTHTPDPHHHQLHMLCPHRIEYCSCLVLFRLCSRPANNRQFPPRCVKLASIAKVSHTGPSLSSLIGVFTYFLLCGFNLEANVGVACPAEISLWKGAGLGINGTFKCVQRGLISGHELFDAVVLPVQLIERGEYGFLTCFEHFDSYTRFVQDTYLSQAPSADDCKITIVIPLRSVYPPLLAMWQRWCRSGFPRHKVLTISHLQYESPKYTYAAAQATLAGTPNSEFVFASPITIFAAVTPWQGALARQPVMPPSYKKLSLLEYTASPVKGSAIAASQIGCHKIWFTHLASDPTSEDDICLALSSPEVSVDALAMKDGWDPLPFLVASNATIWVVNLPSFAVTVQLRQNRGGVTSANQLGGHLVLQHVLHVLRCAHVLRPLFVVFEWYGEGDSPTAIFAPALMTFATTFGYHIGADYFDLSEIAPCIRRRRALILSQVAIPRAGLTPKLNRAMLQSISPRLAGSNSVQGRAVLCQHGPPFPLHQVKPQVVEILCSPSNVPVLPTGRCPSGITPPISPFEVVDPFHRWPPWPSFWFLHEGLPHLYPPRAVARLLTVPESFPIPHIAPHEFALLIVCTAPGIAMRWLFLLADIARAPVVAPAEITALLIEKCSPKCPMCPQEGVSEVSRMARNSSDCCQEFLRPSVDTQDSCYLTLLP